MIALSNIIVGTMIGLNSLIFIYSIKEIIEAPGSRVNIPLVFYTSLNLILNIKLLLLLAGD